MSTAPSISIPAADTIDVDRLRALLDEDPNLRILDVRSGGEYETVHIPGSYNVPLDTLAEHSADLADVEHPVVLVCQTGGRATQAHASLTAAGKTTVHILDGGIVAWEAADGALVRGDRQRWAMDRQVRLVAGGLVLAGVATSLVFPHAKWFAGAVGSGLLYSAVTNTCAMAGVLSKLPYNRTDNCDIAGVLAKLNDAGLNDAGLNDVGDDVRKDLS